MFKAEDSNNSTGSLINNRFHMYPSDSWPLHRLTFRLTHYKLITNYFGIMTVLGIPRTGCSREAEATGLESLVVFSHAFDIGGIEVGQVWLLGDTSKVFSRLYPS
jgi:hypothetical protein